MKVPLAAMLGGLFYVSESFLGVRRRSSKGAGIKQADAGTLRTLWLTAMLSILTGLLVTFWPLGPHLPPNFPWQMMSATVFALGAALRWWAIIHLGRFFTVDVAVANDHRVIDTGPYRMVRHPSYTGLLMMYVGWTLSLNNVFALPVVLIPVTVSLLYRMRVEETALLGALSEDYAAYCRRTKRLVPMIY